MIKFSPTLFLKTPLARERGQAMVEFVIYLTVIAALCSGMMLLGRLFTFDYWAQHDARYLAFERTWAARMNNGGDQSVDVTDNSFFRRPRAVRNLSVTRPVDDDGGLGDLLISFLGKFTDSNKENENILDKPDSLESPIMLAKAKPREKSIWHQTSKEWLRGLDKKTSFLKTALAFQDAKNVNGLGGEMLVDDYDPNPYALDEHVPQNELEELLVNTLEKGEFGEDFCETAKSIIQARGFSGLGGSFFEPGCAKKYNREFGIFLANNIDFPKIVRGVGFQVEDGTSIAQSIENNLTDAVASGFYTFFDTTVEIARLGSVPLITAERAAVLADSTDESIIRMVTDLRYLGSSVALTALGVTQLYELFTIVPTNRDPISEKEVEDTVNGVLHFDTSFLGVIDGMILNPTYLPVPPAFGPLLGGLQEGVMANVMANDYTIGDVPRVDDTNQVATVNYTAEAGLFAAARRRFDTDGIVMSSSYFLVTDPWHISRRISAGGGWREIGTQKDGIGDDSEEGLLRRGVSGLWLVPSRTTEFLRPLNDLVGAFGLDLGALGTILGNVGQAFDTSLTFIKRYIIQDNPLLEFFDILDQIPGLNAFVPTFPELPAVRPSAYPESIELSSEDGGHQDLTEPDKMSGSNRSTIQDYLDEQEAHNPEPKPTF